MFHKTGVTIIYAKPSFLILLNSIIYFIVNSAAVSCERTVAFASPQISQHICRGAVNACRGDWENAQCISSKSSV